MFADLVGLVGDVVRLLQDGELRAAGERLEEARRTGATATVETRRVAVHEINRAIALLRLQRRRIETQLQDLDDGLRFEAEHRLKPVLDEVFALPIADLKRRKRRLSRPQ